MRIVLLGAPGAGKGTQCKNIVARYGLLHLSSGDILRRHRADGTGLGRKAQSYMDAGDLVPDEIIIEMMSDAIKKAPPAGFILDGFPRTVNQAVALDRSLAGNGAAPFRTVLGLSAAANLAVAAVYAAAGALAYSADSLALYIAAGMGLPWAARALFRRAGRKKAPTRQSELPAEDSGRI